MRASSHSALSRFLARLTLRSQLNDEEQRAILGLTCEAREVRANHDILRPGEKTENATLIGHGLAARFDAMKDGRRQLTAIYIPGDMCDLHSVVAPIAGWGLMALSPTSIFLVPHAELKHLARRYPAIAMAFWRDTTVDGSILSKWVGNLGRRDAKARTAHLICEMGVRMEAARLGKPDCFPLDMTQTQLAEVLGLTAVHTNRTLQDLRRDALISTEARTMTVADWQRLCDLAEFDPVYLLLPPNTPN
jgi:CRP-like cAMP-binding protein